MAWLLSASSPRLTHLTYSRRADGAPVWLDHAHRPLLAAGALLARLIIALAQRVHDALLRLGHLLRLELEGELVELAGEAERHVVPVFEEADRRAGIHADIKALIPLEGEGNRVLHGLLVHLLAVHAQRAGAAFAEAAAVELEIEDERVLTGREFGACPCRALEIEEVVQEHRFASADAELAFAKKKAVAAECPALGHDHAFCAAFGNLHLRGDR